MKLTVEMDIDLEESGLNENDIKNRMADFTRELLSIGAEDLGIAITLKQICYET